MSTKKVNESYKAAAIGRKLQSMAEVEPNDMIANAMARLADHLEDFGQTFSAKSMDDLVKKTGMSKEIIIALINKATKKESMSESQLVEGLGELADMAERDHEVQMARADLYKIAKYAIKLHDMLKQVTEAEGIEGWQQSKITKAADYIGSVYHSLDYDMKFGEGEVTEGKRHKSMHSRAIRAAKKEGTSPHKKGTKAYKKHMAAMHAESAKDEYKSYLRYKLAEKSVSKAQQQAAGIALAAKRKGEKPKGKGAAAQMAKMSTKELEKFAGTKHKGLPKHKD